MRNILAFYDMDREYGGPEEGGWWYDSGTFVRVVALFFEEDAAIRAQQRANRLLERLQRHRTPLSSVTYTGGRYRAVVFSGLPPARFPEKTPTYSGEERVQGVPARTRIPGDAQVTLGFDELMVTSDAVERRLSQLRERLQGKEEESEGLFLAQAIRRLEAARDRLRRPANAPG